jgi:hypothetical protein
MSGQVTFPELCPKWAAVVARRKQPDFILTKQELIDLQRSMSRCIVGEAYGWTDAYGRYFFSTSHCKECLKLASRLQFPHRWDTYIPEFVQHWNEKHMRGEVRKD